MSKHFTHGILVVLVLTLSVSNVLMAQHIADVEGIIPGLVMQLDETYSELRATAGSNQNTWPVLINMSPRYGPVGTKVTIRGRGFDGSNTVKFDFGSIFDVPSGNGRTLTFTVPSRIDYACEPGLPCPTNTWQNVIQRSYVVKVINARGVSNGLIFIVTTGGIGDAVKISNLSPSAAKIGAIITVNGRGFTAGDNTLIFGSYHRIQGIRSTNGRMMQFVVPANIVYPCTPGDPCATQPPSPVYPGIWYISVVNEKGVSNTVPLTIRR